MHIHLHNPIERLAVGLTTALQKNDTVFFGLAYLAAQFGFELLELLLGARFQRQYHSDFLARLRCLRSHMFGVAQIG